MKKLFTVTKNEAMPASAWKTGLAVLVGVALAGSFWFASMPIAQAVQMTPAEMIQSKLPTNMTIATATDPQLLEAVCKAVKQWPKEAGLIVRTAAGARKSLRGDILCMAVRCQRERHALDCGWVVDVVRDWIKTDGSEANLLIETISQCAPDCRDSLQNLAIDEGNFGNPPANVNPPPGSVGGGAGGNVCIVCHNGQEIQVACSDLDNFLKGHPGDSAGPCQPTPVTNK